MAQMPVVAARTLAAPPVTPIRGTLLDAATVSDGLDWLEPEGLFTSYNCLTIGADTDICRDPAQTKDFTQGPSTVDGIRFGVYGAISCRPFGFEDSLPNARRVFEARESIGVERAFMRGLFQGADDLTPVGGSVKPKVGVALLEEFASYTYAGAPTIHVPRHVGSLLFSDAMVEFQGDALVTKFGSRVAAGAGYAQEVTGPDGAVATAPETWLYATGAVAVARSELVAHEQLNRVTNDMTVLVERAYVGAYDCFLAAIRVRVE